MTVLRLCVCHFKLIAALLVVEMTIGTCVANAGPEKFDVADSIAWTKVLNFESDLSPNPTSGTALFSPDGKHFLLHTQRGDLPDNCVRDSLVVFVAAEVRSLVTSRLARTSAPLPVVTRCITRAAGTMSHVQWLDNEHVGFIGEDARGTNQAFVVALHSGRITQLTNSKTSVTSFAAASDRVLFYAYTELVPPQRIESVGSRSLQEVIFPPTTEGAPVQLFQSLRSTGEVRRVNAPAVQLLDPYQAIWMSPSGRHAVIFIPATNAPSHWAQYQIPDYQRFGYTPENVRSDPTSLDLLARTRYAIVDLQANEIRPLLDAPSGALSQNSTPRAAFWPDDEQSVVLTNTFLPLDSDQSAELRLRRLRPAIVEVSLVQRTVLPLFWEAVLSMPDRAAGKVQEFGILGFDWNPQAKALLVKKRHRKSRQDPFVFDEVLLTKKGKYHWEQGPDTVSAHAENEKTRVKLTQSLRRPPTIDVEVGRKSRAFYDPNPQSKNFKFGVVEALTWTDDASGITWRGGLVFPVGYDEKQSYPLVVQSHGFNADEFLIDGPNGGTTGFAAQALANVGFVVLQVEDNPQAFTDDEREGTLFAQGIERGIAKLVAKNIVDPKRVGYIGWSRTGMYVPYLLSTYPTLLKAAAICDSVQPGYLQSFLLSMNIPVAARKEMERLAGDRLNTDRIAEWFTAIPLYRMHEAGTAVRIEADSGSTSAVLGLWETFSLLRAAGAPTDFVFFRDGEHNQFRPSDRLQSQGGTLEWFRYWLQGVEADGVDKADQNRRWRELRSASRVGTE
jgi:hypothetical protein